MLDVGVFRVAVARPGVTPLNLAQLFAVDLIEERFDGVLVKKFHALALWCRGGCPQPQCLPSIFEAINLTLKGPNFDFGNETGADRIFADLFPFRAVTFIAPQQMIEKSRLPQRPPLCFRKSR